MRTNSTRLTRTYMSTSEAAALAEVSRPTILVWARRYPGLGTRVAGRVRIDPARLREIVAGRPVAATITAA